MQKTIATKTTHPKQLKNTRKDAEILELIQNHLIDTDFYNIFCGTHAEEAQQIIPQLIKNILKNKR